MIKILFLFLSITPPIWAANVKTLRLCENSVAQVNVSPRGTVIEFPAEPEKVVLGTKGAFSIQYIRSDLAVSPSTMSSRSNLFVYLQGRRFSLDLVASGSGGTLYFIKDCLAETERKKGNGKQR